MFITGGRAGQVGFFVLISILIYQILDKHKIKALITILVLIPGIFFTAYNSSDLFQKRVDLTITETLSHSNSSAGSIGLRLNFTRNSFDLIKKNPLIGVGTGDFPEEYSKVNLINSPEMPNPTNPHNMYVLILAQLGLVGLFSLFSIFYYQIKLSFNSTNTFIHNTGTALPLMFLVIMLSDSYLLGHFTTLMFVFFSSFLYKNFERT